MGAEDGKYAAGSDSFCARIFDAGENRLWRCGMSGCFGKCNFEQYPVGGNLWRPASSFSVQRSVVGTEEGDEGYYAAVYTVFDGGNAVADNRLKNEEGGLMKYKLHGYMTVEAALLMPMVWFSLFFFIFAGFFQYDRCVAEQDGKMIVLRASEMRGKDEASVIRTVMEKGELAGKKKLLFGDDVRKELRITKDRAKIKINSKVNTIPGGFVKDEKLSVFSYGAEYEAKKYDPVQAIRICRRIENYAGN